MRLLFLSLLFTPLLANAQLRGPIVLSPLTPEEFEDVLGEVREELALMGYSADEIDDEIEWRREAVGESPKTWRDADIRSFFPEILDTDQLLYACSVSIASSQTYAYFTPPIAGAFDMTTKILSCDIEQAGMFCELEERQAQILDTPDEFFYTDGSVDDDEARRVATLYRDKFGSLGELNGISKVGEEYIFRLGRSGCACWGDVKANIHRLLFWSWLDVPESRSLTCM